MVQTMFPDQLQPPLPNKRNSPINILTLQHPEKEQIKTVENNVENKGITTDFQHSEPSSIAISTINNSNTTPNETINTVPIQRKTGKSNETHTVQARKTLSG